jgi:hypothetical protein
MPDSTITTCATPDCSNRAVVFGGYCDACAARNREEYAAYRKLQAAGAADETKPAQLDRDYGQCVHEDGNPAILGSVLCQDCIDRNLNRDACRAPAVATLIAAAEALCAAVDSAYRTATSGDPCYEDACDVAGLIGGLDEGPAAAVRAALEALAAPTTAPRSNHAYGTPAS